ncbi:MAG TPA: SCP2 sterol-binding domain-containing protein [Acidimicrobiia bacterium]|jgi:hypothetical protein
MAPSECDDGEPDDLDRLLARVDAVARTIDAADVGADPITVELTVASSAGTASWFVRLDEHGGRAGRGPAPEPTVVIHIDDHTLADLRSGALDVPGAIDGGRLSVRGDLGALARARPALRALASALTAGPD